ncbi:MAG: enoyl-CoA hydratase/isomerase family protein [Solirubrobacterales bacterium]|nr:enoyl-CoA hydratase/isomerase family protein [Solirubrobacterales bacterium]
MSEIVLFEVTDDVAVLTFNRPDRLNAWIPEMQTRYFDLLEECAERPDVRAIVVTGAGRGFCAGADMQSLQELSGGDGSANGDGAAGTGGADGRPVTFPLTIPKPIIAAVNGACAGLGFVYAVMCDLRFAAAEAKFTTAFARRGLVAEHGLSWMLPRLVGPARALDLLLSGRVILGSEAAELGLVNRAVAGDQVLEETLTYARMLASESSPASMARMKHQVYADLEQSLPESLKEANRLMAESFTGGDFGEGVRSFVERRSPNFEPLSQAPAELAS